MEIDLFTLAAQIINLIILLFLLRKFLYVPLLNAVETRQKLIADELQAAEDSRKNAQSIEKKYLRKLTGLEKEKQNILANVHAEAEKMSVNLNKEAEKQYKNAQEQWQKRLQAQQQSFEITLQKMIAEYFLRFSNKALREILGTDADDLALSRLINKIKSLSDEKKAKLLHPLQNKSNVLITTAHTLTAEKRNKIENFLHNELKIPVNVKFLYKQDAELISGITLQADEELIDWSMQSYLQEFQQNMNKEVSYLLSRGEK